MAVQFSDNKQTASVTFRLMVSVTLGVVALMATGELLAWYIAPLIAWDVAAMVYVGWMWLTIHSLDDGETSRFALREDPSRALADFTLLFSGIASLAALGVVLAGAGNGSDNTKALAQVTLGVFSVILAWILTHTIFMLRYAELYYRNPQHAVGFEGTNQPTFKDFAYLAFTMGMTFQVSDTGFKSTEFRVLAVKHALLSYLFGTIIIATTINLVAGLIG